jgi:hypothetical protein
MKISSSAIRLKVESNAYYGTELNENGSLTAASLIQEWQVSSVDDIAEWLMSSYY